MSIKVLLLILHVHIVDTNTTFIVKIVATLVINVSLMAIVVLFLQL